MPDSLNVRSYSAEVTTDSTGRVMAPVPFDPDEVWGKNTPDEVEQLAIALYVEAQEDPDDETTDELEDEQDGNELDDETLALLLWEGSRRLRYELPAPDSADVMPESAVLTRPRSPRRRNRRNTRAGPDDDSELAAAAAAGRAAAAESRRAQGLPEGLVDPALIARVVVLLRQAKR
jgi:hypothetical protein